MDNLTDALRKERLSAYARLRGGYSVPLAGATYWAALGAAGYIVEGTGWYYIALFGSGAIFPLALLYSRIFDNNFIKDKSAVASVIGPAFIGMLLFWPMAIAALLHAIELFPLILAIGLSMHWPVIGWSYGRTGIYSAHAVIRAIIVCYIWWKLPEARLTLLPLSVAIIYLATLVVIYIDSGVVKGRLKTA